MTGNFHPDLSLAVMQQELLYNMASQLSAAAQLRSAQTLHFGQMLGQPTQFGMPGGMSAIQQVDSLIALSFRAFRAYHCCAKVMQGSRTSLALLLQNVATPCLLHDEAGCTAMGRHSALSDAYTWLLLISTGSSYLQNAILSMLAFCELCLRRERHAQASLQTLLAAQGQSLYAGAPLSMPALQPQQQSQAMACLVQLTSQGVPGPAMQAPILQAMPASSDASGQAGKAPAPQSMG